MKCQHHQQGLQLLTDYLRASICLFPWHGHRQLTSLVDRDALCLQQFLACLWNIYTTCTRSLSILSATRSPSATSWTFANDIIDPDLRNSSLAEERKEVGLPEPGVILVVGAFNKIISNMQFRKTHTVFILGTGFPLGSYLGKICIIIKLGEKIYFLPAGVCLNIISSNILLYFRNPPSFWEAIKVWSDSSLFLKNHWSDWYDFFALYLARLY